MKVVVMNETDSSRNQRYHFKDDFTRCCKSKLCLCISLHSAFRMPRKSRRSPAVPTLRQRSCKLLTAVLQDDSDDDFVVEDSEDESEGSNFDSDLDDLDPSGRTQWIPQGAERCQYGMKCTRKNPSHFE
eukprot:218965-Hanusia_phi.AAC.1